MSFTSWARSLLPLLLINVMLVITYPIESIFLDRQTGPAAVVANQLAHWVLVPLLVFCFGLVQPVSWVIASGVTPRRRSTFRAVLDDADRGHVANAIHSYLGTLCVPVALAVALMATAGPLSRLLSDDPAVQEHLTTLLRWRAPWLLVGTLAVLGDFVCYGLGLPTLAAMVVVLEAVVFCVFFGLGTPVLLRLGLSAPEIAALGMLVKAGSTVGLYATVFGRNRWLRWPRWSDLSGLGGVLRTGVGNGLIGFNADASRGAASPLIGHLPAQQGAVISFSDRFYRVFGAFTVAQREFLFASGRKGNDLVRLAWVSVAYTALAYAALAGTMFLLYGRLTSLLASGPELAGALALPFAIRLLGGLAEVLAGGLLTATVILNPQRQRLGMAVWVSLVTNWLVWLPALHWLAGPGGGLTPTGLSLTLVGLPLLQCVALVLVVPALRLRPAPTEAMPAKEAATVA